MTRAFVKHRNDDPPPRQPGVTRRHADGRTVRVSVVIPTADGSRDGYLPALLTQLESQTFQDFEVIVVEGDNRQGRAINTAVDQARGEYIVTFDDDTRLGDRHVIERLVSVLEADEEIGMVGGANVLPPDVSPFVRRVMRELPRRLTQPVDRVTDSDMAEHPCLAMRRSVFMQVGGENELIPRGLDPYLREAVRSAGLRVVVAPGIRYHHLPPRRLRELLRQFFRNGAQSRFCSARFPQWVYETAEDHGHFEPRRSLVQRIVRSVLHLGRALLRGHFVYVACRVSYGLGWLWEMMRSYTS